MLAVRHQLIAWLAILCVPGCVVGDPSYEVPKPGSLESISNNNLSLNGLYFYSSYLSYTSTSRLGKETLNGLAPGPITYNSPGADGLEHSVDGRQILEYLATCALPEDIILVAESGGKKYEFPGLLGLAPEWIGEACDESCQRWVSACLLAHVNAYGETVQISIRGQHPQLSANADEKSVYGFEEAAFYGNLFSEPFVDLYGEDQPVAFACQGRDTFYDPVGSTHLQQRLCGRSASQCKFFDMSYCFDLYNNPDFKPPTCATESSDGSGYADCLGSGSSFLGDAVEAAYDEVITVHLVSETVFDSPPF